MVTEHLTDDWPAYKNVKGCIARLEYGNTLYIPEGYGHYFHYITPGFSMSMRAIAGKPGNLSKALCHIFIMRHYDNMMRRIKGQKWIDEKNERAISDTNRQVKYDFTNIS